MLALLYHRAGDGKYANSPAFFEQHLHWIAERFRVVLPGQSLHLNDVCLTFDDATYDFYHHVFPLLQKLQLKAVLAVPAGFIQEKSSLDPAVRLSVPYSQAMKEDKPLTHAPFCTWEELREIQQSGLVEIASHSMTHRNLLGPDIDLFTEVDASKRLIEEKLHTTIQTFVYPLGKFNRSIHAYVKARYPFAMRIGAACNFSWQNSSGVIYRVLCDNLRQIQEPFQKRAYLSYLWFYLINSLRGR